MNRPENAPRSLGLLVSPDPDVLQTFSFRTTPNVNNNQQKNQGPHDPPSSPSFRLKVDSPGPLLINPSTRSPQNPEQCLDPSSSCDRSSSCAPGTKNYHENDSSALRGEYLTPHKTSSNPHTCVNERIINGVLSVC